VGEDTEGTPARRAPLTWSVRDWTLAGIALEPGGAPPPGFHRAFGSRGADRYLFPLGERLFLSLEPVFREANGARSPEPGFEWIWIGFATDDQGSELLLPVAPPGPPFGAVFDGLRTAGIRTLLYADFKTTVRLSVSPSDAAPPSRRRILLDVRVRRTSLRGTAGSA
jgi:hypothetical protein